MSTIETHRQAFLSADELATVAGIDGTMLARLVRLGLVEPAVPGGAAFPAGCAPRVKRMLRLRVELGVNLPGAAIIVDLLERLARMDAELGRLRAHS